jgi:ribonuclease HI
MSGNSLRVKVHVDGGARGNPGPAGAGVVISDSADGEIIYAAGLFLGHATNNVAEYKGMLHGLEVARTLKAREVEVVSDSELLVRQMIGQYKVKNAGLLPLYRQGKVLAAGFKTCSFRHVRRQQNVQADELVNRAIDEKKNVEGAAGQR